MKKDILILGAGPAGLACAMELSLAGQSCLVVEKGEKVGGLAKTFEFKEGDDVFRTDFGPHRFFSKNAYLYDFIKNLIGSDWLEVPRQTRQYIEGKFYDYPINAGQAFKNIGPLRSLMICLSYFRAWVSYRLFKKPVKSFEDYLLANFGRKLAEFNMINYSEKLWGVPCSQIHPDWGGQRIKGLNIVNALKNSLFKKRGGDTPKTLIESFYYPRLGTGQIYEAIGKRITQSGSEIFTNSFPTRIYHQDNRLTRIELMKDGERLIMECSKVVSSVPITEFVGLLDPLPPKEVMEAAGSLRWRAEVCLFLTLDKEKVVNDNWIYFPETRIPFVRIAEMKNFSRAMSPRDKTSLFIEFFTYENDVLWQKSAQELLDLVLPYLQEAGFCQKSEVRHYYLLKQKNAYPVYTLDYREKLKIVKDYLDRFENLYLVGRPGRFKYTNQDHSLEMGILTARSILENKKRDLDKVGSEEDYFEAGYLPKAPST
ncbi:MAG: FAD-dependent oxidoreductase [Candidatus Pacebacteria bacterium]|nr:FAD-dependent oxidoreductase [Candidatus Paceibacterota bacterium]